MALSADRTVPHKEPASLQSAPVAASTTIYKGSLCTYDTDGYVVVAPATPAATDIFAGIASEGVDNSSGSDGDLNVELFISGRHLLPCTAVAQTDIGTLCYAADDEDVTPAGQTPTTNEAKVGTVLYADVTNTKAWVDITTGVLEPANSA